jgi:zinc-binding alcohol dehydrogenase family protein
MKALSYEKAHTLDQFALALQSMPDPEVRDTDLLVAIHAVGINPGEVFIRGHQSALPGGRLILGWEFAGVVVKAGPATVGFEVGDRVFGTGDMSRDGAWAEQLAVDYRVIAHAPKTLSFIDSATLPIGALTAWECLFRDGDHLPPKVRKVLVIGGAGGVGSMAIQLLKAMTDAQVIATASRPESKQWCQQMGADMVLDHSHELRPQLDQADMAHVDFILSTHATQKNLAALAQLVRPYGHIASVDALGMLDITPLFARSITFHYEMVFTRIANRYDIEGAADILRTAASLADRKKLQPIANRTLHGLSVDTMRQAHELVDCGSTIGKVVIEY